MQIDANANIFAGSWKNYVVDLLIAHKADAQI